MDRIFVLILICSGATAAKNVLGDKTVSYNGYKALEIQPQNAHHVNILKALGLESGVDFWVPPNDAVAAIAMISPDIAKLFRNTLEHNKIPFNTTLNDVGQKFEEERQLQRIASRIIKNENLRTDLSHMLKYLRYNEIVQNLRTIADENPKIAKMQEIGKSFQQRTMYVMKLSNNPSAQKPVVFVEAGTHAREWLSPALALYTINQIVKNPELLEKQDWHFIVSANPDGYEYTHTKDRLWRKTRSYRPAISRRCLGADPNRNYDIYWAKVGTSADPCDETYPGKEPFSEVETRNVRDAVHAVHKRVVTYLSLHTFGSLILYPWGYTTAKADNWQKLDQCGKKAAQTIKDANGPVFTVGTPSAVLYPSAGASDDYFKSTYNIPYAYTIELQGGGRSGFDPPPSSIHHFVQEAYPGLIALATCWQNDESVKV